MRIFLKCNNSLQRIQIKKKAPLLKKKNKVYLFTKNLKSKEKSKKT